MLWPTGRTVGLVSPRPGVLSRVSAIYRGTSNCLSRSPRCAPPFPNEVPGAGGAAGRQMPKPLRVARAHTTTANFVTPRSSVTPRSVTPRSVTPRFVTPRFVTPRTSRYWKRVVQTAALAGFQVVRGSAGLLRVPFWIETPVGYTSPRRSPRCAPPFPNQVLCAGPEVDSLQLAAFASLSLQPK